MKRTIIAITCMTLLLFSACGEEIPREPVETTPVVTEQSSEHTHRGFNPSEMPSLLSKKDGENTKILKNRLHHALTAKEPFHFSIAINSDTIEENTQKFKDSNIYDGLYCRGGEYNFYFDNGRYVYGKYGEYYTITKNGAIEHKYDDSRQVSAMCPAEYDDNPLYELFWNRLELIFPADMEYVGKVKKTHTSTERPKGWGEDTTYITKHYVGEKYQYPDKKDFTLTYFYEDNGNFAGILETYTDMFGNEQNYVHRYGAFDYESHDSVFDIPDYYYFDKDEQFSVNPKVIETCPDKEPTRSKAFINELEKLFKEGTVRIKVTDNRYSYMDYFTDLSLNDGMMWLYKYREGYAEDLYRDNTCYTVYTKTPELWDYEKLSYIPDGERFISFTSRNESDYLEKFFREIACDSFDFYSCQYTHTEKVEVDGKIYYRECFSKNYMTRNYYYDEDGTLCFMEGKDLLEKNSDVRYATIEFSDDVDKSAFIVPKYKRDVYYNY